MKEAVFYFYRQDMATAAPLLFPVEILRAGIKAEGIYVFSANATPSVCDYLKLHQSTDLLRFANNMGKDKVEGAEGFPDSYLNNFANVEVIRTVESRLDVLENDMSTIKNQITVLTDQMAQVLAILQRQFPQQ